MAAVLIMLIAFPVSALSQEEHADTDIAPIEIPQPQYFCGSCHILTYPDIVQKGYNNWKTSKHKEVGCVECHYPPSQINKNKAGLTPVKQPKHVTKRNLEHFSFLKIGGQTIHSRAQIVDQSCLTSKCHGADWDTFAVKKIKFFDKVSFTHRPHLDTFKLDGTRLNCVTCHQHESADKHFEVQLSSCMLCHFKNARFNEGRARCEICHTLTDEPLPVGGDATVDHMTIKEAKTPCGGCHYDIIQAAGDVKLEAYYENNILKTVQVMGAGVVKPENCRLCHDEADYEKLAGDAVLMHKKHITPKEAKCMDCHRPINHAKGDVLHPADTGCNICHETPHENQKILTSGSKHGAGKEKTPDLMFAVRTNCFGCHTDRKINEKGASILAATGRSCDECHEEGYADILEGWKEEIGEAINEVEAVEKLALKELTKANLPKDKKVQAMKIYNSGHKDLSIVKHGKGVHNMEYSATLLENARSNFEELREFIKKK